MSNYQFIVNHQTPTAIEQQSTVVVKKAKHPGRVAAGKRLAQWNRENKGLAFPKTTLKSMLNEIKKDTNNPVSILIAIEETVRILNDRGLEIYLTLKKTS